MSAGDVLDSLVLIANARMPSHRAQSLQVAQMGGDVTKFVPSGVARRLRHHFGYD